MGEPVRILDLAEDMIRLHGLKPYEDVDVVFTGLRPGEKLFEELDLEGEHMVRTRHQKIFIGQIVGYPREEIDAALEELRRLAESGAQRDLRSLINELLPDAKIAGGAPAPAIAERAVAGA
jgi:FlaA1/EpsC-like NDP-sugar epimerase